MKELDDFLKYAIVSQSFSGQVLVANDDGIWLDKGYGKADKTQRIDVTESTIFDIGAVSAQFTAAAILKLNEQGMLSVVDRLDKFFDDVPEDKKSIMVYHLVTHSSGLLEKLGGDYDEVSRSEMVRQAMASELVLKPGSGYAYSTVGYSLLAAIIEIATGMSYENYLNTYLFELAEMDQTGFLLPKFSDKDVAVGYTGEYKWGKPMDHVLDPTGSSWYVKGTGGFLSNASDLYSWYHAIHGETILGPDYVNKLFLPEVEMHDENSSFFCYGWKATRSKYGGEMVTVEGNNDVFASRFNIYLESGIVIIILTNAYNESTYEVFDKIESHVFGVFSEGQE